MPLRRGLRLSVVAVGCAGSLAAAGTAKANDVVLWACHSSSGQALGAGPFAGAATFGTGCNLPDAGGVEATPGKDLSLTLPPNLKLEQVLLSRTVSGLGTEQSAGSYAATFKAESDPAATTFDSATLDGTADVSQAVTTTGASGTVKLSITGDGAKVDVSRIGFKVADDVAPEAAVGGQGNVRANELSLNVDATDAGVGLDRAEVWIDGTLVATKPYQDPTTGAGMHCTDLTPGDGTIDLAFDDDCMQVGTVDLIDHRTPEHPEYPNNSIDISSWPDGNHTLTVKVFDAAGNETDKLKDYPFEIVNHPNLGANTATLNIQSGASSQNNGSQNGASNGGTGGVKGASATSCSSPKLSMELSQKPLRVSHGHPVLKKGKRYRFRGRLTCLVGNKRHSAARSSRIDLLNIVGKHTVRKGGTTVRAAGKITIILSEKSSRTLVFRYTNADGKTSQVKLKIQVASR
jgi:hypothetical protein